MVKGRINDSDDEQDEIQLPSSLAKRKGIKVDSDDSNNEMVNDKIQDDDSESSTDESNQDEEEEEIVPMLDRSSLKRNQIPIKKTRPTIQEPVQVIKEKKEPSLKKQYVPVVKDCLLSIKPILSQVKELETPYHQLSDYPHYIHSQYKTLNQSESALHYENKSIDFKLNGPQTLAIFKSQKNTSKVDIMNTGGSIWAMDFVPEQDIIVVGGYTTDKNTIIGKAESGPGNFQIWSKIDDEWVCTIVVCHNWGAVFDIKVCPLQGMNDTIIAVLACSFGDGHCRILSIPNIPTSQEPSFISVTPLYTFQGTPGTLQWRVDWRDEYRLSVGCMNGNIALYDTNPLSTQPSKQTLEDGVLLHPTHYIELHNSTIRCISHINPDMILSVGHDGCFQMTSLDAIRSPHLISRNTTFQIACTYSKYLECGVWCDIDFGVKIVRLDELLISQDTTSHGAIQHDNEVWSIDTSDYFPFLATCSADGTLKICNMGRMGGRKNLRVMVKRVYKLMRKKGCLTFEDGKDYKLWTENRECGSLDQADIAIHKCVWSRNEKSFNLLASGGFSGLLRIDDIMED